MDVGEALRRAEIAPGPDDSAAIFAEFASVLGARSDGLAAVVADVRNPYKGLRPFLEADALDFFGREAFIRRLLDRLSQRGPIVEVHRGRRAERERQVLGGQRRPGGGTPPRCRPRLRGLVRHRDASGSPSDGGARRRVAAGRCASARRPPRSPRVGAERAPRAGGGDRPRRHRASGDRRPVRGDVHAHRGRGRPGAVPREPPGGDRRPGKPGTRDRHAPRRLLRPAAPVSPDGGADRGRAPRS